MVKSRVEEAIAWKRSYATDWRTKETALGWSLTKKRRRNSGREKTIKIARRTSSEELRGANKKKWKRWKQTTCSILIFSWARKTERKGSIKTKIT